MKQILTMQELHMKSRTHAERKREIAQVFMDTIANPPTQLVSKRRITVADLARILDMDRKTFYNYFDDISDMMVWIFRDYIKTMLERPEFATWKKVYPDETLYDKYSDWPIYARNVTEDLELDQGCFFKEMAYHWEDNRAYYTRVFRDETYLDFFDYIVALYLPVFRDDILIMLDGRELPEIVLNFLAEYHTMGVFGRLRYHFARTGKFIMQEELGPFWNYAHLVAKHSIDSCFSEVPETSIKRFLTGKRTRFEYKGIS